MNKKLLLYVFLIIIVSASVFFAVVYLAGHNQANKPSEGNLANQIGESDQIKLLSQEDLEAEINSAVAKAGSLSEPFKSTMINNKIYELAVGQGNTQICDRISDSLSADYCREKIAIEKNDESICGLIADNQELKLDCQEEVALKNAVEKNDLAVCEDLIDEMKRNYCLKNIIENISDTGLCEELKDEKNKMDCLSTVGYNQAKSKNDTKYCDKITDRNRFADCYVEITGNGRDSDADMDGLSYWEEIYYGANPELGDSDFDGYKDGDEVKSGWSPVGDYPLNYTVATSSDYK